MDTLQPLCLAAVLLLSLVLPLTVSAWSVEAPRALPRLLPLLRTAQLLLGLAGLLIIAAPLHSVWGLVAAVGICVGFRKKLRRLRWSDVLME